jgi:hypothetical protein
MATPRSQWSPPRKVLADFIAKMEAAGYPSFAVEDQPALGRDLKTAWCELKLSQGLYLEYENTEYPVEIKDVVLCYVAQPKGVNNTQMDWIDTCHHALNSLVQNTPGRSHEKYIKWDGAEVSIDRVSPLENYDGTLIDSALHRVARIELPVEFLSTYTP